MEEIYSKFEKNIEKIKKKNNSKVYSIKFFIDKIEYYQE